MISKSTYITNQSKKIKNNFLNDETNKME